MKRVLLLAVLCLGVVLPHCLAQTQLSESQKKNYNELLKFLKEEGFSPSLVGGELQFKKEGITHWIIVGNSDEMTYVSVNRPGFQIGGEDGHEFLPALKAANLVNKDLGLVKLYCTENAVRVSVELFVSSMEGVKYMFYKSLSLLQSAKTLFVEKYSEMNKEG